MFPLYIAKHYFNSKYSKSAVNVIAWVSMSAIAVVTAAMVIIFSVINGFDGLVKSMYNSFYPPIKVEVKEGKLFTLDETQFNDLKSIEGVEVISRVLEERSIFMYGEKQYVGVLKGVDDLYEEVSGIDESILKGQYALQDQDQYYAVLGAGVAHRLGMDVTDPLARLRIYMPKKGFSTSSTFNTAFNSRTIYSVGSFTVQQEIDIEYVITHFDLVKKLLKAKKNQYSALEIKVNEAYKVDKVLEAIQEELGDEYEVLNRYEQNKSLYSVMKMERWAVYIILSLILLIASFNIVGFLIMLVLEKKEDIKILSSMGATAKMIKRIVLAEGLLISIIGTLSGIIIASLLVWIQQYFGVIQLPGTTFVVEAYPVELRIEDLLLILVTVGCISFLSVWYPAKLAAKRY
jgi:lipoprotein-releasing system permease protein